MVTCCAIGCVNRSDRRYCRGVTFHKFPSEPVRRELWVQAVQRGEWQPAHRSVLCSAHFNEEDFDRSSASSVRLRPGAIPTKFPDPNTKSRKTVVRSASSQYFGFFSLSARLCELSAAIQKEDVEAFQKEEEIIQPEEEPPMKIKVEEETLQKIDENSHQILEDYTIKQESEASPENPKQVSGIKRKHPDVVPNTFSEINNSSLTISKIPKTDTTDNSEAIMPHRFLEIQLNEKEKHRKIIKPDILSQVMSCNENLAVTVSTIPNNIDSTITAIKIPRNSQKQLFKNDISVKKTLPPLPHEFLEVELKVLEEQQPEVKLFLSDEISIRKISRKNNIPSDLTVEPALPLNMRKDFLTKFRNPERLNQT